MSGDGRGVAAANAVSVPVANPQQQSPVAVFQCAASVCAPTPIQLSASTTVYLILYGTGIRNHSSNVTANIGGANVPVQYAGPQPSYAGLDQVNLALPQSLSGSGQVSIILTVDGQITNVVTISIQ
jgi:uncharacterized protein (TIGR03437 family)